MHMEQKARVAKILDLLQERQSLTLPDLTSYFGISKDTARRDILKLVEQDLAERTRGGVTLPKLKQQIENYTDRLIQHSHAKQRIAKRAASLIHDKHTVWLDVSTTVQLISEHLATPDTFLVTNSVDNALSFSKQKQRIYLLGGFFHADFHLLNGASTIAQIHHFHFDVAFIGASGITNQGVFYPEFDDIQLHQAISDNASKTYLLIDSSKFHVTTNFKMDFTGIDAIITNSPIPKTLLDTLKEQNIACIIEGE